MRKLAFFTTLFLSAVLVSCGGKYHQEDADELVNSINSGVEMTQDDYAKALKICDKAINVMQKENARIADLPEEERLEAREKLEADSGYNAMCLAVEILSIELDDNIEKLDAGNLKYYRKLEKRVKEIY